MAEHVPEHLLEAYNTLLIYHEQQGISFVFKTNELTINNKIIKQDDYKHIPHNDDIQNMLKINFTGMHCRQELPTTTTEEKQNLQRVSLLYACVQTAIFNYCTDKNIAPDRIKHFIQAEYSEHQGLHFHVLLWGPAINPKIAKWIQKHLLTQWSMLLLSLLTIQLTSEEKQAFRNTVERSQWVNLLQYKHPQTKKEFAKSINPGEIITHYFLKKPYWKYNNISNYFYCTDSSFTFEGLSFANRLELAKCIETKDKENQDPNTDTEQPSKKQKLDLTEITPQDKKIQKHRQSKEDSCKNTIETLFTKSIHTTEKWMLEDPDSFIHFSLQPNGEHITKLIMKIVQLKLSKDKTALDLILENTPKPINPKNSKTYKIFKLNNIHGPKVLHAMMCILNRNFGKQNCIALYGPTSTGKSLIAENIARSVQNYGCHNPANENFPFSDLANKNLGWFEEMGNPGKHVNQFKALTSGQNIRVDQKNQGSIQLTPLPILITSNEQFWITKIGSTIFPEHTKPIQQRCIFINLFHQLPPDFGLLAPNEIGGLFRHLINSGHQPTFTDYIQHWNKAPDWGEPWTTNTDSPSSLEQLQSSYSEEDWDAIFNASP
ncbi:NS1 [Porcine parvovirus 8]|uniref:NS1 n=1 Tax=Porcine parvovirus 8 TaxID=2976460 RepID=UPI00406E05B0|nr:NS1 [Porcine parvovirus 8]